MSKAERAAEVYRRLDATSRSLENFSVAELGGITLGYDIKISNLGSKRKSDLIKAIRSNSKYRKDLRRKTRGDIDPLVKELRRQDIEKRDLTRLLRDDSDLYADEPEDLAQQDFLDEVELEEKGTDISYTIMEKANQTSGTDSDWYANELRSELSLAGMEMGVNEIRPGDFIFFGYTARYPERYPYYDRRPLSFVLDMKGDKMFGCNVHYLNPDIRDSFALTMINKTAIQVPKVFEKTLHSYFYTNISGVYRIPENEYGDIARLVTEDFVDSDGMPVDLNAVWDSVN